MTQRLLRMSPLTLILGCALATVSARAQEGDDPQAQREPVAVTHALPHQTMTNDEIRRTTVNYTVPAIKMVRDDGTRVSLDTELNDGRPVVLNFIYTSCTTICPLSSQEFSQLQQRLGADRDKVHLVSISIDPEEDTPARLRSYARHFHAGKEWQHYTSTQAESVRAQQAFHVYRGAKMDHTPVTLLRATPDSNWVRFDGFVTADELYAELRNVRDLRAAR